MYVTKGTWVSLVWWWNEVSLHGLAAQARCILCVELEYVKLGCQMESKLRLTADAGCALHLFQIFLC